MYQRKKLKKGLDLQKKSKKEESILEINIEQTNSQPSGDRIEDAKEKDVDFVDSDLVEKMIGTFKDTLMDPIGPEVQDIVDDQEEDSRIDDQEESVSTEEMVQRRKYTVKEGHYATGNEIEEFIESHKDFKILNLVEAFEDVDLVEFGLNLPSFNGEYIFPKYPKIDTYLDLETIPKEQCGPRTAHSFRTMLPLDEDTLFNTYANLDCQVLGKNPVSFRLKERFQRVKKVKQAVYLFYEEYFISYEREKLQRWNICATDIAENNLGEILVLERDRCIKVFRRDNFQLVRSIELNIRANGIVSYKDRRVVVSTCNKILFILDMDSREIEIISGPPNQRQESLDCVGDIVILRTNFKVFFLDLGSRIRYIARFKLGCVCFSVADLLITLEGSNTLRYFDIQNPRNNLSVDYKVNIREMAAYKDRIYLNIGDCIRVYRAGVLLQEYDVSQVKRDHDFTNVIFTEDDFDRWKAVYSRIEEEKAEFLPNELNVDLKKDVDRILGRGKLQKSTFTSQKSATSSQRKKKGGF